MAYYDDEVTDRAVEAYFRYWQCKGNPNPPMPSRWATRRNGVIVTIANVRGTLMRFRVRASSRLDRLAP
jgi:hypothetical protein